MPEAAQLLPPPPPPQHQWLLRAFHVVFLVAFCSFYAQFPALNGRDGLLPLNDFPAGGTAPESFPTGAISALRALFGCIWTQRDDAIGGGQLPRVLFSCGHALGVAPDTWVQLLTALAMLCCVAALASAALSHLQVASRGANRERWRRFPVVLMHRAGAALLRVLPPPALLHPAVLILCLTVYYICVHFAGQVFMSFQWDILLLEAGLVAVLIALSTCRGGAASRTAHFMLHVIAFKLLFLSGAVKVQSRCPTWTQLSALEYHYATQCLPTPLAFYVHMLSPFVHSLAVAATLGVQVVVSIGLVATPFTSLAFGPVALNVGLQVLIAMTGNYNFFNLLTILLLLGPYLAQTSSIGRKHSVRAAASTRGWLAAGFAAWMPRLLRLLSLVMSCAALVIAFSRFFRSPVSFGEVAARPSHWLLHAPERVEPLRGALDAGFSQFVSGIIFVCWRAIPASLAFNICLDVLAWVSQLPAALRRVRRGRLMPLVQLALRGLLLVSVAATCIVLADLNLRVIARHDEGRAADVPTALTQALAVPAPLRTASLKALRWSKASMGPRLVATLQANYCSPYGLFRHMTGVGNRPDRPTVVARPELILEGSPDHGTTWIPIEFHHKPGNVFRPPTVVAPHQPRLDWQMWFAALSPQPPDWLIHLVHKILSDADPLVMRDDVVMPHYNRAAFNNAPPTMMRIRLYHYDFNTPRRHAAQVGGADDALTLEDKTHNATAAWWVRRYRTLFLQPLTRHHTQLDAFLRHHRWDEGAIKARRRRQRSFFPNDRAVSRMTRLAHSALAPLLGPLVGVILLLFVAVPACLSTGRALWPQESRTSSSSSSSSSSDSDGDTNHPVGANEARSGGAKTGVISTNDPGRESEAAGETNPEQLKRLADKTKRRTMPPPATILPQKKIVNATTVPSAPKGRAEAGKQTPVLLPAQSPSPSLPDPAVPALLPPGGVGEVPLAHPDSAALPASSTAIGRATAQGCGSAGSLSPADADERDLGGVPSPNAAQGSCADAVGDATDLIFDPLGGADDRESVLQQHRDDDVVDGGRASVTQRSTADAVRSTLPNAPATRTEATSGGVDVEVVGDAPADAALRRRRPAEVMRKDESTLIREGDGLVGREATTTVFSSASRSAPPSQVSRSSSPPEAAIAATGLPSEASFTAAGVSQQPKPPVARRIALGPATDLRPERPTAVSEKDEGLGKWVETPTDAAASHEHGAHDEPPPAPTANADAASSPHDLGITPVARPSAAFHRRLRFLRGGGGDGGSDDSSEISVTEKFVSATRGKKTARSAFFDDGTP